MDFILPQDMPNIDIESLKLIIKQNAQKTILVPIGKDDNLLDISEVRDAKTGEVVGEVGVFNAPE